MEIQQDTTGMSECIGIQQGYPRGSSESVVRVNDFSEACQFDGSLNPPPSLIRFLQIICTETDELSSVPVVLSSAFNSFMNSYN